MPNEIAARSRFAEDEPTRLRRRVRQALLARARARPRRVLRIFARASSARPARCISSGAASISRSRASPGRRAPLHPGGMPNLPDSSHARGLFPRGDRARASGPAAARSTIRRSTPTPIRRRRAFRRAGRPAEAFYIAELGEFILPYDAVRTAADPDATLMRSCNHLRGGGRSRQMGPRGVGVPARREGEGEGGIGWLDPPDVAVFIRGALQRPTGARHGVRNPPGRRKSLSHGIPDRPARPAHHHPCSRFLPRTRLSSPASALAGAATWNVWPLDHYAKEVVFRTERLLCRRIEVTAQTPVVE